MCVYKYIFFLPMLYVITEPTEIECLIREYRLTKLTIL